MKFYFFIALFCCATVMSAQKKLDKVLNQYNTHSIPYISVEELKMQQAQGEVVVLDSREPKEYEVSHIEDAQLVGYTHFSIDTITENIKDKDTPIVVYCSLGIRSEEIGEKLKKAGFTQVKNLYGGIFEWKNKEYPVFNLSEKETDSVHTCTKPWSKWLKKGIKVYD
ncbi:rhodanese-like domain-containing protein [Aureisphaera galaxeae]|uniref:rhodanese-like domain-containing protein n=1 Tax=Aureisphaera galaxeae TaxID=1538023 RepID=UPI00235012F0|nr:rhodanese-like domain-containing protein [Aureisphaera galaxeae]MDC8002985.1 rhodanese-like domain-containing protein [Aureisphaera galaxeae]